MKRRVLLLAAALTMATGPGCGDDDATTTTSSVAPSTSAPSASSSPSSPTSTPMTTSPAGEVDERLLVPSDVGEGWSTATDVSEADLEIGASPCEGTALNPTIVARLQPETGVILTADGTNGMLSMREMIVTGGADRLATDLGILIEATNECFTRPVTTTADAEQVSSEPLALPAIGDQSFGMLTTVAEPPDFTTVWQVRTAMVRVGGTAVVIDQLEVLSGPDASPTFTDEQFAAVLEQAVARIGG